MSRVRRGLLWLLIVASLPVALYAFAFQLGLAGGPEFPARFGQWPLFTALHLLGSGLALGIGGFQFLPSLRARHIAWHRWLGRTYLLAVLFGGMGGLFMAMHADGGLTGRVSFTLLAVVWLVSGWQAYAAVRRGDVAAHRVWMIRNFALTFAAVTLRVYLGLGGATGIPFAELYPVVAWLCWVPNLLVAEWLIVGAPPVSWRARSVSAGSNQAQV
ncbi:MAG TPA: DUF2306 domain-containing protein [Pseudomonadales bacterium]